MKNTACMSETTFLYSLDTLSKKWNIPLSIILFTQSIALNSKIFVELLGIYPWNLNLLGIYRLGIV